MADNRISEDHESYGMIGISRVTGTPRRLFGSSISHSNTIILTIKTGEKDRHLNRNWFFGNKQIVSIEMSAIQFSEMITSLNMGDGVPCTLRDIGDGRIEDPPATDDAILTRSEFKEKLLSIADTYAGSINDAKKILLKKGSIKVKDREKAWDIISAIYQSIRSTLPFINESFNKSVERTVLEAKGEIESFVENKIRSTGIQSLRDEVPMIESEEVAHDRPIRIPSAEE